MMDFSPAAKECICNTIPLIESRFYKVMAEDWIYNKATAIAGVRDHTVVTLDDALEACQWWHLFGCAEYNATAETGPHENENDPHWLQSWENEEA